MTLIYEDETVTGPATHAFVIGVGSYPFAKKGKGTNPDLRSVRDLPSAADSAKLMCDWLIANRTSLARPLKTIELLISDPVSGGTRYTPVDANLTAKPIAPPDASNVKTAGQAWDRRLRASKDNLALFYACGHGANLSGDPVIFLSDLNEQPGVSAWSYVNVRDNALGVRQIADLHSGYFFVDACGESIKDFALAVYQLKATGVQFMTLDSVVPTNKVLVLCAASEGVLAFDGKQDQPLHIGGVPTTTDLVKIGRFTQTLLKGLGGASARWDRTNRQWVIDSMHLLSDLKALYRLYFPKWNDKPFEPMPGFTQNDHFPLVRPDKPLLPVVVRTSPDAQIANFTLRICYSDTGAQPWVAVRDKPDATAWLTHVPGDAQRLYYAVAVGPASAGGAGAAACHAAFFLAKEPSFDGPEVPIP